MKKFGFRMAAILRPNVRKPNKMAAILFSSDVSLDRFTKKKII